MNTSHIFSNLIFSLNATMPLFIMMVLGFFLKKTTLLDDHSTKKINQLVFKVFLPALIFMDLSSKDFLSIWDTKMVVFCFIVTVISIVLALLFALFIKNKPERGEFVQAAYRSGAATLGIAFMTNIYDDASMVALMIIGSVPLYNVAAVVILDLTSGQNQSDNKKELWMKTIKNVITNPIIIGIVLGMIWSLGGLKMPPIMDKSLTYLGNLASPLALIGLGACFEFCDIKDKWKETCSVTGIKLLLWCIMFLPIAIMLGFRDEKLVAILTMLGSATTSSCFIMAKNMGHEGKISSCSVMATTLISSFTLTLWLFILRTMGYI